MTSTDNVAAAAAVAERPAGAALRRVRAWAVAGVAVLVALGVAWEAWLAPTGRGLLVLKVVPVALALPGLWRLRLFTYRWLSLLVWLYVLEGLVRATTEPAPSRWLAVAETALALGLFVACVAHVRLRLGAAAGSR